MLIFVDTFNYMLWLQLASQMVNMGELRKDTWRILAHPKRTPTSEVPTPRVSASAAAPDAQQRLQRHEEGIEGHRPETERRSVGGKKQGFWVPDSFWMTLMV